MILCTRTFHRHPKKDLSAPRNADRHPTRTTPCKHNPNHSHQPNLQLQIRTTNAITDLNYSMLRVGAREPSRKRSVSIECLPFRTIWGRGLARVGSLFCNAARCWPDTTDAYETRHRPPLRWHLEGCASQATHISCDDCDLSGS